MSDISDVAIGLAYTLAGLVYPNGLSDPLGSVTGRRTIIRRGWLLPADLNTQGACSLRSGVDYVTVRPLGESTREIPADLGAPWRLWSQGTATVSLAASGQTVTVSLTDGSTPTGIVGVQIRADDSGALPDRSSATYVVQSTDTAATIAAALAGQFAGASSSGAVLTIPAAVSVSTIVGDPSLSARVLSRQTQNFVVTVWSDSWKARDALGRAITAGLISSLWFNAGDGWPVNIPSAPASQEIDTMQMQGVFRRDIRIACRYDTIETLTSAPMLFGVGMLRVVTASGAVLQPFGAVPPVTGAVSDGSSTFYEDAAGNIVFGVQQPYSGLMTDASGNVLEDSAGNLAGNPS